MWCSTIVTTAISLILKSFYNDYKINKNKLTLSLWSLSLVVVLKGKKVNKVEILEVDANWSTITTTFQLRKKNPNMIWFPYCHQPPGGLCKWTVLPCLWRCRCKHQCILCPHPSGWGCGGSLKQRSCILWCQLWSTGHLLLIPPLTKTP